VKQQTNINVDKILRVKLIPCRQSTDYTWTEAKPEKKFLWWVSEKAKPAGWITRRNYHLETLSEEDVLKYEERIFKRYDVPNEFSIWEKARVEIESMGGRYTNSDYVYFETDEEAISFVNELSVNFPHIKVLY
jgi:tRNA uridine 5-carbamoylmethylation protein Kti12